MAGKKKDEDKAASRRTEDSHDHAGWRKPVSVYGQAEGILKRLGQMQCIVQLSQPFDRGYFVSWRMRGKNIGRAGRMIV